MKERPPEMNFIIGYAELVILLLFTLQNGLRFKDKTSLYLFVYPLLSIPSLLFAQENIGQSIFLTALISLSAFLYLFYLRNIDRLLRRNIFALIVLTWIFFGVFTKVYEAIKFGSMVSGSMSLGLFGITSRGGGMGGSNHAAGIILLFLPFVKNYIILALGSIFILSTFSRGAYIVIILFWLTKLYPIIRVKKMVLKGFFLLVATICLLWIFSPQVYKTEIVKWTFSRIVGSDYFGNTVIERTTSRYQSDVRWEIYGEALSMLKKTFFQGVGLGGFYWGQRLIGKPPEFSNAHNLYLTELSEGGILFFLCFIGLLVYMFRLALKYSRDALLSLAIFSLYGLFSGQLYEASGLASGCDYYYFIFVLAYLRYFDIVDKNTNIINFQKEEIN